MNDITYIHNKWTTLNSIDSEISTSNIMNLNIIYNLKHNDFYNDAITVVDNSNNLIFYSFPHDKMNSTVFSLFLSKYWNAK